MSSGQNANLETLETLQRLSKALKDLDESGRQSKGKSVDTTTITSLLSEQPPSKEQKSDPDHDPQLGSLSKFEISSSSLSLSHWRELTTDVESAYKMMEDGANLVKSTSTKYTLVGKINVDDGAKLAEDLRKGSELIAAGAFVIHSPLAGCGYSCRSYAKKTARGIVATLITLVQSFIDGDALEGNVGAQKTGAVWSCCDEILNKLMPKGNRVSMKRDLLIWMKECNETISEFQEMLDLGPSSSSDIDKKEQDDTWDDFIGGSGDDQYSESDFQIAKPSLAIIKCSKGAINCVSKTCEFVGEQISKLDISPAQRKTLLQWISHLHDKARAVGGGMTDLGALLYPPLVIEGDLPTEIESQTLAIIDICELLISTDTRPDDNVESMLALPAEILELATKIRNMVNLRRSEAESSLSNALSVQ